MESLDLRLKKRMHVSLYALIFMTVLLGLSVILEGCADSCETKIRYTYFEPVYKTVEEMQAELKLAPAQPLKTVGKMYRRDHLLFVNDPGNGIHIIDNSSPSNPIQKAFLQIPGNYELAVSGNALYADNYGDLVVFDISDIDNIHEVQRMQNVFSGYFYPADFAADGARGMIVGWEEKEMMEVLKSDCKSQDMQPMVCLTEGIAVADANTFRMNYNASPVNAPGNNGSGPGAGGSMARFAISGNHLYALNSGAIIPINISNLSELKKQEPKYLSWDIETIFPYKQNLFIGSSSGMYIMDVSDPGNPTHISTYQHIRSCDPVVVDDQYAYVTLRSGTECAGFTNQLEVINIEDLATPQLVKIYPMTNPFGLGIDRSTLFVCDGADGLKIFDASDVNDIASHLIAHYNSIDAYDVIPMNDVLVMVGQDGIFQYDYSTPSEIKLLSHIPSHGN
jgi:hypothetical protein